MRRDLSVIDAANEVSSRLVGSSGFVNRTPGGSLGSVYQVCVTYPSPVCAKGAGVVVGVGPVVGVIDAADVLHKLPQ